MTRRELIDLLLAQEEAAGGNDADVLLAIATGEDAYTSLTIDSVEVDELRGIGLNPRAVAVMIRSSVIPIAIRPVRR